MVHFTSCHSDGTTSLNYGRMAEVRGQKHSKYSFLDKNNSGRILKHPQNGQKKKAFFLFNGQGLDFKASEKLFLPITIEILPDPKGSN